MKKDFKELVKRTTKIGYGLEGFGTFNIHHINNMTNVVAVASDHEAMIKYEHFDHRNKTNLFVILHGVENKDGEKFELTTFIAKPGQESDDTRKELDRDEFFKEVDQIYKFIEKDPASLTYLVTYDLYEIYKAFRNFYDQVTEEGQFFNWKDKELLDAFNNHLWENRISEEDPVDIEMETFLELDRIYKLYNKKSDHSKPILRVITNKTTD